VEHDEIRCVACGTPIASRSDLVLATQWCVRLRTYCLSCFDESQKGFWGPLRTQVRRLVALGWVAYCLSVLAALATSLALDEDGLSLFSLSAIIVIAGLYVWMLVLRLWARFRIERRLDRRVRATHPRTS
jgi:hypothetical protein